MKLYVCHGTWMPAPRKGGKHPCGVAYKALTEAGYDPEVTKVRGWNILPDAFNGGRKEVKELTGSITVPVLITDDGQTITESAEIAAWAKANPATA